MTSSYRLQLWLLFAPVLCPQMARSQTVPVVECPLSAAPPPSIVAALSPSGSPSSTVRIGERVCGDPTNWLALADLPFRDLGSDYGWRLVLLADTASGVVIRFASSGLMDSYRPDLRLFRAGHNLLALLAMGDEGGSWGIAAYRVWKNGITGLGVIDVGTVPPERPLENPQSALAAAQPHFVDGEWRVDFAIDVTLWPNQERARVKRAAGKHLRFAPAGDTWRLVGSH